MTIIIGVSGDRGSFSEEAALVYAKQKQIHPTICYLLDMEGVLCAIEQQTIDLGIFPVVNRQGGLVTSAFEAMGKHCFELLDELWLYVRQCLLVVPGTEKQHIKNIVSHPQGLAQCTRYLTHELNGAFLHEWCDTARAANDLAQGILGTDTAVIAPKRCAALYGLDILAADIQDSSSNLTAFIVVTHIPRE